MKLEEARHTLEKERSIAKKEVGELQAALRKVEQQSQELLQVVQTRAEHPSKGSRAEDPCDTQLTNQDSHREEVTPQGDDVIDLIRSQMLEVHGPCREMAIGSLDHFAYNLVNHSAHCILELIQNADDAEYAPDVCASQHFIAGEPSEQWPQGYLFVACNERGFSASDVRALCNINKSEKAAAKTKKTGRKGIGFKSCRLAILPAVRCVLVSTSHACMRGAFASQVSASATWCMCFLEIFPSCWTWPSTALSVPIPQEQLAPVPERTNPMHEPFSGYRCSSYKSATRGMVTPEKVSQSAAPALLAKLRKDFNTAT